MAISWVLPVRGVQLLFAIIILGLSGWLVSKIGPFFNDSEADFNLFTALWTMLVSAFFIGTSFVMTDSVLTNPMLVVGVDVLSWIFWLSAWACMASQVSSLDDALRGFPDIEGIDTFTGVMKAIVAFGVFEWLLFTATAVYNGLGIFRGTKSSGGPTPQGV